MSDPRPKIAIVGGGIGGLTLAHALLQRHFDVQVYERSDACNEVGAGITIWNNALLVYRALGLYEAITAKGRSLEGGCIGTASGKELSSFSVEDVGADVLVLTIHRAIFQECLYEQLPPGTVHFSKAFERFEDQGEKVGLSFEDGSTAQCDLLVGADGIHSAVRSQLLHDEPPRYSGYTCFRGVVENWPERDPAMGEFWGRGRRFGMVLLGEDKLYWYATQDSPPRVPVAKDACKSLLLDLFGDFGWGIPEIIGRTDPAAIHHNDIIDRPPVSGWSRWRVCLLGDAIHPTTPNMGQGAAMAIESAWALAQALEQHLPSHDKAFAAYENKRAARSRDITVNSWRIGSIGQWKNPLATALRDLLVGWTPQSASLKTLSQVANYDVTAED